MTKILIALCVFMLSQVYAETLYPLRDASKKIGLIDKTGKWVIEPLFDSLGAAYENPFNSKLIRVEINGKYGFINHSGQMLKELDYEIKVRRVNKD